VTGDVQTDFGHIALAVKKRGGSIESVHYGSIAIVDRDGNAVKALGNPDFVTFSRSTLKPLQAVPLFAHSAFDTLALSEPEKAVLCASHSGEPRHAEAVLSTLNKIGSRKGDLQCGVHTPLYFAAFGQPPAAGEFYNVLQHNCSGKHAGMLALAKLMTADLGTYLEAKHPVQQAIAAAVTHFSGIAELTEGVDNCSAPNFALPLSGLARAYAKLGSSQSDPSYGDAHVRIFDAMAAHPQMVSGLGRVDLALTHAGGGDWISKVGSEGMIALAIRQRSYGIVIKICDGDSRAAAAVAIEVLRQLDLVKSSEDPPLAEHARPTFLSDRGTEVGEMNTVFEIG
jgi:L-asparaginase II